MKNFIPSALSKRHFLLVLVLLTGCGESSLSKLENVFDGDNRVQADVTEAPWSSLGRISTGCTGSLVAPFLVLTSAHCVYDTTTKGLLPNAGTFDLGYAGQNSAIAMEVSHVWIGSDKPEIDRKNDWALLRLKSNASEERVLAMQALSPTEPFPIDVSLGGYSDDLSQGSYITADQNCQILKKGEQERLLHNCDSASGISGAPLLQKLDNKFFVAALAVSEYRDGATGSVIGKPYSDKIANVAIGIAAAINARDIILKEDRLGNKTPKVSGTMDFSSLETDDVQACQNGQCIASLDILQNQANTMYHYSEVVGSIGHDLINIAHDFDDRLLGNLGNNLMEDTAQISEQSLILMNRSSNVDPSKQLLEHLINLNTRVAQITTHMQRRYRRGPDWRFFSDVVFQLNENKNYLTKYLTKPTR